MEICFKNPRSKAPEINISRVAVRFYSRFFNDFSRSDKKKKKEKPTQGLLPLDYSPESKPPVPGFVFPPLSGSVPPWFPLELLEPFELLEPPSLSPAVAFASLFR